MFWILTGASYHEYQSYVNVTAKRASFAYLGAYDNSYLTNIFRKLSFCAEGSVEIASAKFMDEELLYSPAAQCDPEIDNIQSSSGGKRKRPNRKQ